LKKRKAKREGGRIGFQEGTPTMEEIVVTGISPTSSSRRLKQRGQRYFGQGPAAHHYPILSSNEPEMSAEELQKDYEEKQKDYEEKQEEAERLTQLYLDELAEEEREKIEEATLWADYYPRTLEQEPEQAEYNEWLRNSILDEATGERYSPEEWRKMVTSREANVLKRRIRRGKRRIEREKEKRDKESSGGKVNV
jgi:hypothetical protein